MMQDRTPPETPMMALFQTPTGEGIQVEGAPKRGSFRLDPEQMRLMRARTFARYRMLHVTIEDIARTFNRSASTVKDDVKWLTERYAAGLSTRPDCDSPGDDADG